MLPGRWPPSAFGRQHRRGAAGHGARHPARRLGRKLELSNFQLIDLQHVPRPSLCLMIASEHGLAPKSRSAITAKQQLFRWQKPEDRAIYYADKPAQPTSWSASARPKNPVLASTRRVCRWRQHRYRWPNNLLYPRGSSWSAGTTSKTSALP